MYEVLFLSALAFIWILFASVQDLKNREVANWVSFSLIIFALSFRFFYSLFYAGSLNFFYQGLIGLGIFFVAGNLFYYGRIFAGGDAKLMIALGAVLPFSESFLLNAELFVMFFFIFLGAGAFYGLIWSLILSMNNFEKFKKRFSEQLKEKKIFIFLIMFFGLVLIVLGFINILLLFLGLLFLTFPFFYLYAKTVDEVCMVKKTKVSSLTEGDWLYEDMKIGKKVIVANWDGLSKEDIKSLRKKYKIVKIRQGIPFVPVFLISFIILVFIYFRGIDFGFRGFF